MEITPVTPAARTTKVRITKPTVPKTSSKAAPAVVAKPPITPRKRKVLSNQSDVVSPPDLAPIIATAAYFLAERRHFAPGHELEDWLCAEQQVIASATGN